MSTSHADAGDARDTELTVSDDLSGCFSVRLRCTELEITAELVRRRRVWSLGGSDVTSVNWLATNAVSYCDMYHCTTTESLPPNYMYT